MSSSGYNRNSVKLSSEDYRGDRQMPISKLSEATIRRNANAKSFERGEAYYQAGAVVAPTYRGNALQATVEGSEAQPYRVSLCFDGGGITSAHCTCAYDFEGWCKHIVATMLVCLLQPETIEERPTLRRERGTASRLIMPTN